MQNAFPSFPMGSLRESTPKRKIVAGSKPRINPLEKWLEWLGVTDVPSTRGVQWEFPNGSLHLQVMGCVPEITKFQGEVPKIFYLHPQQKHVGLIWTPTLVQYLIDLGSIRLPQKLIILLHIVSKSVAFDCSRVSPCFWRLLQHMCTTLQLWRVKANQGPLF